MVYVKVPERSQSGSGHVIPITGHIFPYQRISDLFFLSTFTLTSAFFLKEKIPWLRACWIASGPVYFYSPIQINPYFIIFLNFGAIPVLIRSYKILNV